MWKQHYAEHLNGMENSGAEMVDEGNQHIEGIKGCHQPALEQQGGW